MSAPDVPEATPEELPLLVGGDTSNPERLMLIARPRGATVLVREWSSDDWARPPVTREHDVAALVAQLERASRSGRAMNQSLHAVRRWLGASQG